MQVFFKISSEIQNFVGTWFPGSLLISHPGLDFETLKIVISVSVLTLRLFKAQLCKIGVGNKLERALLHP